ncbi:MAG: carbamoyl-phosphate synthase (glutamine-hydrolyzing) large subunit [Ignisphaera sp.]|nr:carbamoyl-phosphate synthase (glutamine-hydrolyzing) large subunit [Ignisphaera sp.]MCX8167579.1 carbamoyl-phosphate synthase (glutamine-hydrolyzing) large subunit [Ignisphaera sp.]MDW8085399.1 carbamoyl-phosphate synthase (glutamine-hydrolyzing) large subunit [Ignisphaera sp.]
MVESIRKVLVVGSGAIKIAEAAEFDYSGSQALKALKEEGMETILINPNIATIQTGHRFADKVYLAPIKPEFITKIIDTERPDGIMIGFGGQTALSMGVRLYDTGVLSKYGVRVLGTPIEGVRRALSRELFRKVMVEHEIPIPPSAAARSIDEAKDTATKLGYPVMVRVSFNLGGAGSFVAWSEKDLLRRLRAAFAQSEIGEVLIEKYLHHWKEIEFEVVRDAYDNVAAIACLENLDPMGVHTGESIVIAPCQTLTDYEYQLNRNLSIAVERAIMLIGEGNVQLAQNPWDSDEIYVIETNPRMSRSSALASKATGYPLAYIAAKLALGYSLYEIINKVTGRTSACFEPSLDYVVIKIPRWDLDKFEYVEKSLGTEMKSVGEVMAIGRSFLEALQKAIRMLDIGEPGLVGGPIYEDDSISLNYVMEKISRREPYWPIWVAKAFKHNVDVDRIHQLTGIDNHFLKQIKEAVDFYENLRRSSIESFELPVILSEGKRLGFSDEQLSRVLKRSPDEIRSIRIEYGIRPVTKQIDTLAAEWPAKTNYLYLTYNGWEHDVSYTSSKPKIVILGAGGFRIGVSVEFDWSIVMFADEARKQGYEVVVINYNPETVSTDWDMNEKLYFDEITVERVLDVYELERPLGAVTFLGGQISNNIAWELEKRGVALLGTSGASVHKAENRALFSELLDRLGIKQPPWIAASSVNEVVKFADDVGYPVLVRPSYVLSGSAMKIAWNKKELIDFIARAAKVSPKYPAVVSKFIDGAIEFEIDAVGDGDTVVGAAIEHIEPAGVHSGDATMSLPPRYLPWDAVLKASKIAMELNSNLNVKGPFNLQLLYRDGDVYVIELNLRASRSMPFTSKVTGYNLMRAAVEVSLNGDLTSVVEKHRFNLLSPKWFGVKSPQFSWTRLRGAYPFLGPEMRSVGEVACLGRVYEEALILSWLSVAGNRLPERNREKILVYTPELKNEYIDTLSEVSRVLSDAEYSVVTIEGMEIRDAKMMTLKGVEDEMVRGSIGLTITVGYNPERDYRVRRLAVDLGIPIVLNHRLGLELSKALLTIRERYHDLNVIELKEFWTDLDKITLVI